MVDSSVSQSVSKGDGIAGQDFRPRPACMFGPAPTCSAVHTRVKQSEMIIPSRPWHPVAVNLNTLVALRGPSCVFVDHSFSFVSGKQGPDDGADHTRKRLPIVFKDELRMDTNWDGPPSMTNRARMYLRYRDLDIPTSWEGATRERGRPARNLIPASSLRSRGIPSNRAPNRPLQDSLLWC